MSDTQKKAGRVLHVVNVPEELYVKFKVQCVTRRVSIRGAIVEMLRIAVDEGHRRRLAPPENL